MHSCARTPQPVSQTTDWVRLVRPRFSLSLHALSVLLSRRTPRLQYTFRTALSGDWKQAPREDPTPIKQTEQEPTAERDAPDTDVKDVTTKKLTFKNQNKPRPKIAKCAAAFPILRAFMQHHHSATDLTLSSSHPCA
jgi:hypothetical protein